jgi:hypothetical protein
MSEDLINKDKDVPEDIEDIAIPEEEKQRIVSVMIKMMEMGIGAVYGQEDEGVPDAVVECDAYLQQCKAVCCTFAFALTKGEVQKGMIKHNTRRPFFIARDSDGYCPHLDRSNLRCTIWSERPLRCRRYDCRNDPQVMLTITSHDA